jgi:hypothetical protein
MQGSSLAATVVAAMACLSCGGGSDNTGGSIPKTCLPGASDSDCQLCGPTLPSDCTQVCPSVDCSVYPVPSECSGVCSGATCCTCNRLSGDIYYWQLPQLPPQCGSACSDMLARWESYLADPGMVACSSASDCTVVGGQPSMDFCNCHTAIGYCGKAANAATYHASPAANLETEFASTCTGHAACDCGPGYATCTNGKCTIAGFGCCFGCGTDAGLP